jgi:hemerythrin-like domain-containing protein
MLIKLSTARKTMPLDLVDLLLECHERIRRFTGLAREVGIRFEAPSSEVVEACASVERYFSEALPLHVADEEHSILPRLQGKSADVDLALKAMAEQHARHEPLLRALLDASALVRATPHDRALRSALADAASSLDQEFAEHLGLEESQIFPAIRRLLEAEVQAQILSELRARRTHEK